MTFISLGLAAILIASSLLRGTYYPVYQHTIFMLVAVLFIIAFTRWGLNGVGQGIGSITIWVVLLAVVSISSSLWSAAPILSVSNIFIYIAFALFQLLFSRTWQGTVYKHKPGVEFWLLGFAIMGALVSLTGIIGALLQIYPWSMAVDGVIVASSCLEYPNGLAIYALMALAPTLYLRSITAGHRERWFITGLATLQVGGILLAFSKTGLLFLAILTVYIFTRTRAGTIRLKHFVIAGGVLVVLASIILVGTVNSGGIANLVKWAAFDLTPVNIAGHRLATWQGSLNAWLDRPWLGWGSGTYDLIYQGYALDSIVSHAHNLFLHTGVELGLLGMLLTLALYAYCFRLIWLAFSLRGEGRVSDLHRALAFSCLVFLVNNLWDFTFFIPAITFLFLAQATMLQHLLLPALGGPLFRLFKP